MTKQLHWNCTDDQIIHAGSKYKLESAEISRQDKITKLSKVILKCWNGRSIDKIMMIRCWKDILEILNILSVPMLNRENVVLYYCPFPFFSDFCCHSQFLVDLMWTAPCGHEKCLIHWNKVAFQVRAKVRNFTDLTNNIILLYLYISC